MATDRKLCKGMQMKEVLEDFMDDEDDMLSLNLTSRSPCPLSRSNPTSASA